MFFTARKKQQMCLLGMGTPPLLNSLAGFSVSILALSPVHTGDYSRDCRQIRRQSPFSATIIAKFGDCR